MWTRNVFYDAPPLPSRCMVELRYGLVASRAVFDTRTTPEEPHFRMHFGNQSQQPHLENSKSNGSASSSTSTRSFFCVRVVTPANTDSDDEGVDHEKQQPMESDRPNSKEADTCDSPSRTGAATHASRIQFPAFSYARHLHAQARSLEFNVDLRQRQRQQLQLVSAAQATQETEQALHRREPLGTCTSVAAYSSNAHARMHARNWRQ